MMPYEFRFIYKVNFANKTSLVRLLEPNNYISMCSIISLYTKGLHSAPTVDRFYLWLKDNYYKYKQAQKIY